MPNSVGESGAFINPGNPGIIEGIFLLHHHTHHRHAPPGLRRSRPKARTVLAFTPHALVCGVFFGRGVWREARSRHESTLAARPTPPRPSPCQGRERPAGHADVQAEGDAGRARFPPAKGGQGGLAPAPTSSLASPRPLDACARVSKGLATPSLPCRPSANAPAWGMKGIPPPSRGSPCPFDAPKRGTKGYPDTLPCPAPTLGWPTPGHRRGGRPLRWVSTTLPWVSATLRRAAAGLLWVSGTLRWVSATLPRVADTLFRRGTGQGERPAGRQRGGGRQSGPGHGRSCPGGSAGGRRPGGRCPQAAVPGSFLTMRGRRAG